MFSIEPLIQRNGKKCCEEKRQQNREVELRIEFYFIRHLYLSNNKRKVETEAKKYQIKQSMDMWIRQTTEKHKCYTHLEFRFHWFALVFHLNIR